MPPPVPRVTLTCGHCGASFEKMACELTRGRGRYCSRKCSELGRRTTVARTCATCGGPVERKASHQRGAKVYCSRDCWVKRGAKPTTYRKQGGRHAHRVVAEQMLGRSLRSGEVVHHRDGDQHNNDPANLEVLPSQADHARLHVPAGHRVGS